MPDRRQESFAFRLEAAELARSRTAPEQLANGEEQRYAGDLYFMSFTKGLPHNPDTGLLDNPADFVAYRRAINDAFIDPFTDKVPHGAETKVVLENGTYVQKPETDPDILNGFRQWEAPTAGVVFELEGPDPQAVTMPPAPALLDEDGEVNVELALEMAEVYELAVLRDVEFRLFEGKQGPVNAAVRRLDPLTEAIEGTTRARKMSEIALKKSGKRRLRRRRPTDDTRLDAQTVFRGSSPDVEVGPYLSQFMLIGTPDINGNGSVAEGKITYGVLQIDQKVPIATPKVDFMRDLDEYVLVQRGDSREREGYVAPNGESRPSRRFISTPRDLATYVHYDALYEAYLNACLILLGMGTPFDPGFDHLSGVGAAAGVPQTRRHAGGFALYGGPHVLNLVTEVSTRALKAVRFQKFNNHIRLRPEALAARVELVRRAGSEAGNDSLSAAAKQTVPRTLLTQVGNLSEMMAATLQEVAQLPGNNYFLPMAFPEGSPMHPSYGAGHATVAGACVTMLKAFFDTSAVFVKRVRDGKTEYTFDRRQPGDQPVAFRPPQLDKDCILPAAGEGATLEEDDTLSEFLTLEGELNKLAANISIGRNMAGVHYFSDYYDSVRMGEEIAIGILEEQALGYSTDPFVLSVPTFDGDVVRIGRR